MFTNDNTECSTKISIISQNKFDSWLAKQQLFTKNWCLSNNFKGEKSKILKIPYPDGRLNEVIIGEGLNKDLSGVSKFASSNKGNYYISTKFALCDDLEAQKAWSWGNYNLRSKSQKNLLYVENKKSLNFLNLYTNSLNFSRDLINLPANEINPVSFFKQIQPQVNDYVLLVREKRYLERTKKMGGWGERIKASILIPGDQGEEVVKLRNRLIRMGLMQKSYSPFYDNKLKRSVRKFQMLHGLSQDGIAGEITLNEINKPIKDRLMLIVASLERRRWLNRNYEQKYLIVNIPEFKLRIVEKGKTIYQSKVVVGQNRPNTRTPEFSNKLQFMIINPSWYVPKSIILEEYLPEIRKNINAASELFFTDKQGNFVAREDINFEALIDENFPYGMKQPPSKDNALGAVKFMLPNIHNIYLHDTPHKNLFSEEVRAFSHGCVRVHQPFELASELLSANFSNPEKVFNNLLKNEVEFKLDLKEDIPVHITYSTVWSDNSEEVNYRRDIYGRDAEIYKSLQELGLS